MTFSVLALIGATIVFSSFLSGVFGMAGGMVLLGVLLNYFDVPTGMIFFSIIQLFANGWRVVQWHRYVLWPIFGWYLLGAVIAFGCMWMIAFVPDKAMVYLSLGVMPFVVEALPASWRPNIEWRGVPFFTGVVTTIIQIRAGNRARDCRHLTCAFCHRAHDRSRLSAVDARDHFRHQLRLSCPRRVVALARLRPRVRVFRLLARPDDARDP